MEKTGALASIVYVTRTKAPAVLALDHVVQQLDALLDVSVRFSLPQAAASGCVRWFDRVYNRLSPPPIENKWLYENTISKAMEAAVAHGHLAVIQRIHLLHAQRLPVQLLAIAASNGHLHILQWLLAHRTDGMCIPEPYGNGDGGQFPSCCLRKAFKRSVTKSHFHIVKWLIENGFIRTKRVAMPGNAAAAAGDLEMVQWLHTRDVPKSFSKHAIDDAAQGGHLEIVQFLLANRSDGFTSDAVHYAFVRGHQEIHEALRLSGVLPNKEFSGMSPWERDTAAMRGRLDLLQSKRFAIEDSDTASAMAAACRNGHLAVVQWLHDQYQVQPHALHGATRGHLSILQWLHETPGRGHWSKHVMDMAARKGHLAMVQWLHENRTEGCTTRAMDEAAKRGHLEVVQWLHVNRLEGCTTNAMDDAAMRGHLEIVQWLHVNRPEGCTTKAMDQAAEAGHLEMIQWLHENRREGCTTKAMDDAAAKNYQEIVEFLHVHRTEGCSSNAMDQAAQKGHLEMVLWLHNHRQEGCGTDAMDYAAPCVLKWLHTNRQERPTTNAMRHAASRGDLDALEFLHAHYNSSATAHEVCCERAVVQAAGKGHLYIVQWLYEKYPELFPEAIQSVLGKAIHMEQDHILCWMEDQEFIPKKRGR